MNVKNGPAELNSLKRESGRSGWLSVAGDEISCGGEKVRRRDWEKGVKSEEKRREEKRREEYSFG